MEKLALQLNIKSPEDWGNILTSTVSKNGGHSILLLFGGSLYQTLRGVYQGYFPSSK